MILDFFSSINLTSSAILNTIIQAAAFEGAVFIGIPLLGLLIELVVVRVIREMIGYAIFGSAEPYFSNYFLFAGVVIHELSHALFAFVTGAKITEIALFKPEGNSLGHVAIQARGDAFMRSLQRSFSACAPVVTGSILLLIAVFRVFPAITTVAQWTVVIYLFISILFHMNMSSADLKCYFKGAGPVLLLLFPICLILFFVI